MFILAARKASASDISAIKVFMVTLHNCRLLHRYWTRGLHFIWVTQPIWSDQLITFSSRKQRNSGQPNGTRKIEDNAWKNPSRHGARWWVAVWNVLSRPGRWFFLKLAPDSVKVVNSQTDQNGLPYTETPMAQCGLSKYMDGVWNVSGVKKDLHAVRNKYVDHSNGL